MAHLHKLDDFSQFLLDLASEFNRRFEDFRELDKFEFPLFNNPFNFEVSKAPSSLQMELIDLQCDSVLKGKYNDVNILTFYTEYFKSYDNYPEIKKHAARILCMFGSSYLCEQMFSVMNINKNQYRSKLSDEHLNSILKINTSEMTPNIEDIMKTKRSKLSGSSR